MSSDEQLLRAYADDGDREAMGDLLQRHAAMAWSLALGVTRSAALAEEAVQEAWLRALRSAGQWRNAPGGVRSWLAKIVVRSALNLAREESRRARREEAVRAADGSREHDRPEDAAARREAAAAVRAALAALPDDDRLAVVLTEVNGFSQTEASAILEVPQTTISKRARRGLDNLRRSLEAAGFGALALAPALAALGQAEAPVSLAAALENLVSTGGGAGMEPASTEAAAKGGLAMKITLGVVAAGALAGIIGLMDHAGPMNSNSPPAAKGPLQLEPYWGVGPNGYLDGPRTEAMNQGYTMGTCDDDGNLYAWSLGGGYSHCGLRALQGVMASGRVIYVGGNDYFQYDLGLDEGPASCLPPVSEAVAVGQPAEGKGCLYVNSGGRFLKLWKNPDKEGRWWFKRVFAGSKPPPTERGAKAPAADLGLTPRCIQVDRDGKLYFNVDGSHYAYDPEGQTVTCILTRNELPKGKDGQPMVDWSYGGVIRGGDGCFYASEYSNLKESWRIPAGGGKAEPYVRARYGNDSRDGPALHSGWFCGPHFNSTVNPLRFLPPDCLLITCHDESWLRRVRSGRVSTLCADGEWRELEKNGRGQAPGWFRNYVPGPNNVVYGWLDSFRPHSRVWRVPNVDLGKPTTGPALGEERSGK